MQRLVVVCQFSKEQPAASINYIPPSKVNRDVTIA
jgi:hypothetical protein